MDRRKFVKGAGALAASVAIAGCMGGESGEATDAEPDASSNNTGGNGTETETGTGAGNGTNDTAVRSDDFLNIDGEVSDDSIGALEVVRQYLYLTANGTGFAGIIENTGDRPYEFVEVTVTMYDDANEILYEFVDESEDAEIDGVFGPGERWNFDVVFEEVNEIDQIQRYTIAVDGDVAENVGGGNNSSDS